MLQCDFIDIAVHSIHTYITNIIIYGRITDILKVKNNNLGTVIIYFHLKSKQQFPFNFFRVKRYNSLYYNVFLCKSHKNKSVRKVHTEYLIKLMNELKTCVKNKFKIIKKI